MAEIRDTVDRGSDTLNDRLTIIRMMDTHLQNDYVVSGYYDHYYSMIVIDHPSIIPFSIKVKMENFGRYHDRSLSK